MRLIFLYVFISGFSFLSAQKVKTPYGVTRITTASGVNLAPKPDKAAASIKQVVNIHKDNTKFSLRIEEYRKGDYYKERMDEDWILLGTMNKGDKRIFELVPDLSNSSKLSLFVYNPGSMWLKTRYSTGGKLKLIQYNEGVSPNPDGIVPILLIYEDDKANTFETKLRKLLDKGRLPIKYIMKTKLFKELPHCMIVYYQLKNE